MQGSPEGTIQVQLTLLAKESFGQPELAASSDARLQAALGQAGQGDIVQTGNAINPLCNGSLLQPRPLLPWSLFCGPTTLITADHAKM